MEKREFINRMRSLCNIDRHFLPELNNWEWEEFRDDPWKYFIHADKAQSDAIFREVERRQAKVG